MLQIGSEVEGEAKEECQVHSKRQLPEVLLKALDCLTQMNEILNMLIYTLTTF